jgi:DNA-binding transcriptional ArsR family regulator
MREILQINDADQARRLLNPVRLRILALLRSPMVAAELAEALGMTPQRVNNHLRELREAGLVEVIAETRKGHLIERTYRASARTVWLSPRVASHPSGADARSLHNLQVMAERLQDDAAALLAHIGAARIPSVGVTAEITLKDEAQREEFSREYLRAMHALLEKYQEPGEAAQRYTAMLVCYPAVRKQ